MEAPPSDSACVHLERLPCEAGRGRRCGSSSTCSWLADNGASGPRTTDVICGTGARLVGGGGVGPRPMCFPGARGARLVVANHDVAGPARPRPDQPGAAQPSPGEARPAQPRPAQAAQRSSPEEKHHRLLNICSKTAYVLPPSQPEGASGGRGRGPGRYF